MNLAAIQSDGMLFFWVGLWVPCFREFSFLWLPFYTNLKDFLSLRTLQFLVSPIIGGMSDRYGRKPVLLLTMIGNILSALMCVLFTFCFIHKKNCLIPVPSSWIQSTTFASYMLSRVVGGLSEGNVQLAL